MAEEPQVRVRVSVSRTSKGLPSYDCTVEVTAEPEMIGNVPSSMYILKIQELALTHSAQVEGHLKTLYGSEWKEEK